MNTLKNKVQLIGNIGRTPELVTFESGKKLARIRMATNDYYKNNKGEREEKTEWHTLVAWGKQAELITGLVEKGQAIAVEGKIVNRNYETKEGDKRTATEIYIKDFQLLGKKQNKAA